MSKPVTPNLSKWPFFLGDLLLLILAGWIMSRSPDPFRPAPLFFLLMCVGAGGWLCVTPFLVEYRAALKLAESGALTTTVEQIHNLRGVGERIAAATSQWQILQEQSTKTAAAAKEVAERMTSEAQAFGDFMQKANDSEKGHLRLEVDKLRRGEADWVQTIVRILDHVYALYQAGVRSGQPALKEQLGHFQNACRETARRLGLVVFEARPGESFDEKTHQLLDPQAKPPPHARVVETVAAGYTFQGQFLRCAVVNVAQELEAASEPEEPEEPKEPEEPEELDFSGENT
jgi:molecular chaperone GrpE (heat shock protein)